MDGTPAQRRWATSIRVEQIEKLTRCSDSASVEAAGQVGSSEFWIEHRNSSYSRLVDALTDPAALASIAKTKRKAAAKTAGQADAALAKISAARLVKKFDYLVAIAILSPEVPASLALGHKFGELVQGDTLHRIFAEPDNTLRIISGPATGLGEKVHRLLKVTPEMLAEIATF